MTFVHFTGLEVFQYRSVPRFQFWIQKSGLGLSWALLFSDITIFEAKLGNGPGSNSIQYTVNYCGLTPTQKRKRERERERDR